MNTVSQHNIGAFVAVATSVEPQAASAGTLNGASIDRAAHNLPLCCLVHQAFGGDTGAPASVSVQSTLQHSPDNATWANYTQPGAAAAAQTAAVTTINTDASVAVDLSSANRYIRVQTVVSFTGGTTPTALVAADVVLGGEALVPAA